MKTSLKIASGIVLALIALSWLGPADETLHRVESRATLNLSPGEAWSRLRQFDKAHHYVPGLASTEITTEQREGIGASRRVTMEGGFGMDETVTDWRDGRGFTIRLHDGDDAAFPFSEAEYIYQLTPREDGRTEILCAMQYRLRGGAPMRWLHDAAIVGGISSNNDEIVANLKEYYEQGASR